MADFPTRNELFQRARAAALLTPGTQLSPEEIDRRGSDANLLFAAMSLLGEEVTNRAARAYAKSFEDTATGDALDRVVFDRKGLLRNPASFSVGSVELTRPTFAAGAGTIDGGPPGIAPPPTRIRTNQGIVVLLTQPAVFGAADLGPITVTAQAELAGLDNQVGANQGWNFVDVPFDPSIVISNPTSFAGASDEESDEAFRERAKDFFPTVRRGTLGAIEFGLRSVPGVASVSVIEVVNPAGLPACSVQAFILDELGQANDTLAAQAQLALLDFRGAGIPVTVIPGTPQFIEIDFVGSSFDTSLVTDTSRATDDVRSAIVAALNNQRPGQNLLRSTILAAARSVVGFIVEDSDLIEPAGTLIPSSNDIAFRTLKELISVA